jgi:hypothetical protein
MPKTKALTRDDPECSAPHGTKKIAQHRDLDIDARLRASLARAPDRAVLVVESDAFRCADLQIALAALGPITTVWSPGDIWPQLIACPAAAVVFGEEPARLCDFAAPKRLRRVAPTLPLVLVTTRPVSPAHAALFDAIVETAVAAVDACRRIRARRT